MKPITELNETELNSKSEIGTILSGTQSGQKILQQDFHHQEFIPPLDNLNGERHNLTFSNPANSQTNKKSKVTNIKNKVAEIKSRYTKGNILNHRKNQTKEKISR